MDRISTLPDEILGHILSFLPTKQAASTSLLSKRWRNVFVLVSHLNLVYNDDDISFAVPHYLYKNRRKFLDDLDSRLAARRQFQYDKQNKQKKFMDFVESLLRLQGKSLIKKFTLEIYGSCLDQTRVQNWICNVLGRGVVDLNLLYEVKNQPLSLLIFKNNTLVKLRLGGGLEINLSQDVYLPKLKTLRLDWVVFDGVHDVCETLLPGCPVLEELVIQSWVKGSSVSSRSLKKLTIRFSSIQTISFDVPNLVYLDLSCYFGVKYVNVNLDSLVEARLNLLVKSTQLQELRRGSAHLISADTIDIIIRFRNVRVLHLSNDAPEMFYFSGEKLPKFDSLVRLCISSYESKGWQILPILIKNSPNLETLIFEGLHHCKTINRPSCLSSCRVKVLEIWGYRGTLKEVNQMKHFLKKLPCLEMVKIKAVNNLKAVYIQQLFKFPRASSNCKIQATFNFEEEYLNSL